ncbi:MAG: DUF1934 domain-containing protein [Halanaerobiales bacterium]
MKREIELSIKSEQFYGHDNSDIMEHKGSGKLYRKRSKYFIIYEDENFKKTSLRIIPGENKVIIHRQEPELKQIFIVNNKTKGKYVTPYGVFKLGICTSNLDIVIGKEKGIIKIKYDLYMNGHYTSKNYLSISWDIL